MAVIKCKMCGGDLPVVEGQSVVECEWCGSKQTIPNQDNEKKLTLFARANRLRAFCEFDKAAGIYESIVADCPQEAEAYWGLVLCKYGIEYVDDPGTGKKIPTCHRSSFESVLEDSDFEQAMENADAVARKVYREEAKQIEQLRKGIIEVSGKEQPYDIFICYKETAEDGDRTIDSVIAQDVYDALISKGYRVFFSRITLEDKLGQEYEPYIFAALNSAKVMLAFGTDYEYYNAVWVKNEWSRYLKLMAKDKTKHLIPCYKGIDAYDMPKEFAKLQAQDMGKVGAMQDLLRGIEKILPKTAPETVVWEKVLVGGSGDNKIASLLDRGYMALEDRDWDKADSFFEDVLNNEAKNAQAYIGKTLVVERCRTLDALVRKRWDAYGPVKSETLCIPERTDYIVQMEEKYTIPGYLKKEDIRRLYGFDRRYTSQVAGRQLQYQQEETWWKNHKLLSRAEQFATGAVAEILQAEKKRLFSHLSDLVQQAQQADKEKIKALEKAYDATIQTADQKAETYYHNAAVCRESDYQTWLGESEKQCDPYVLLTLAESFVKLGVFRDSAVLAENCQKQAMEEWARRDAEIEQKKAFARAAAAKRKKTGIIAMVAVVAAVLVVTKVVLPGNAYKQAEDLLTSGQYQEAITAFENLGDYKDSPERVLEVHYKEAQYLCEIGDATHSAMLFGRAGNYGDAKERAEELWEGIAVRNTISAGDDHTVGLKSDGTVVAVGSNKYHQCDVSQWTDIVAVSAGDCHTVGLKSDGTVVAADWNEDDRCDVSQWTDIVAVSAGGNHTVGLKSDGTVVAVGKNEYHQCDVSQWRDIVAVSAGVDHTVGLKSDGTVVAVGKKDGRDYVSQWRDIVAVSAGGNHTVGLKSDGTVVAVGSNRYGQCDVSQWRDIVAVNAGWHTVGLKSDGTVVAVGSNKYGQCDVSQWTDIVAVSAGGLHTVGLKSDGTVVAVGYNGDGRCDVGGWKNIRLPGKHQN